MFVTQPNAKVELMEPLGEGSPIAGFLERNPDGGMHHICYGLRIFWLPVTSSWPVVRVCLVMVVRIEFLWKQCCFFIQKIFAARSSNSVTG